MRPRQYLRSLFGDAGGWGCVATASVLIVALVGGTGYLLYRHTWPAFAGHPYFALRTVRVACDTDAASPGVLAARAGLYDGTSLWGVDVHAAETALEAASWVRAADVSRRFPDHVDIRVHRREPLAATLTARGPFLIDRDGVIYREEGHIAYPDVPWVTGWDRAGSRGERITRLRKAMSFIGAATDEGMMISQVHVDTDGVHWAFPESHQVSVRLGEHFDAVTCARRLRVVLATLPSNEVELREIDLTHPDRAVLRSAAGRVARTIAAVARRQAAMRYADEARLSRAGVAAGGKDRG